MDHIKLDSRVMPHDDLSGVMRRCVCFTSGDCVSVERLPLSANTGNDLNRALVESHENL
jgi:hypothetical protein